MTTPTVVQSDAESHTILSYRLICDLICNIPGAVARRSSGLALAFWALDRLLTLGGLITMIGNATSELSSPWRLKQPRRVSIKVLCSIAGGSNGEHQRNSSSWRRACWQECSNPTKHCTHVLPVAIDHLEGPGQFFSTDMALSMSASGVLLTQQRWTAFDLTIKASIIESLEVQSCTS
jgi:hypothetical protein